MIKNKENLHEIEETKEQILDKIINGGVCFLNVELKNATFISPKNLLNNSKIQINLIRPDLFKKKFEFDKNKINKNFGVGIVSSLRIQSEYEDSQIKEYVQKIYNGIVHTDLMDIIFIDSN